MNGMNDGLRANFNTFMKAKKNFSFSFQGGMKTAFGYFRSEVRQRLPDGWLARGSVLLVL